MIAVAKLQTLQIQPTIPSALLELECFESCLHALLVWLKRRVAADQHRCLAYCLNRQLSPQSRVGGGQHHCLACCQNHWYQLRWSSHLTALLLLLLRLTLMLLACLFVTC
jgi:hypothetical protein